jgi:hypothetical protein
MQHETTTLIFKFSYYILFEGEGKNEEKCKGFRSYHGKNSELYLSTTCARRIHSDTSNGISL